MNQVRHFKSLLDINKNEFLKIINHAIDLKKKLSSNKDLNLFENKTLAMIFKKNSTRTRIAFETAMTKMGGHAIFLSEESSQISRGENLSDTAKVLSGMVDAVMIRTHDHNEIIEFSSSSNRDDLWRRGIPMPGFYGSFIKTPIHFSRKVLSKP